MKVLIINTVSYTLNGISNVIVSSVENLKKIDSSIQISLTKSNGIDESYQKRLNGLVEYIDIPRRKKVFKYIKALKKISSNYDVIHVHGNSATMTLELMAFFGCRSRVVMHGHTTQCTHKILHKILQPFFCKFTLNKAACSKDAGNFLYGKKDKTFKVLPNGIESDKFKFNYKYREELRKEYSLESNIVFLHVGLFNDVKNQEFLIKCFTLMKNDKYKLVFIGDGPNRKYLEDSISEDMKGKILFLGPKADVYKYYSMADVFLLPSLYESFGIVLLEAQTNGLPSIASEFVSKSSLMDSELVEYLPLKEELWIDATARQRLRKQSVENIGLFDVYNVNEILLEYYRSILKESE